MTTRRAPREGASKPSSAPRGYNRDVTAAVLRHWLFVLPYGEAQVLSRLVDQIYVFSDGKAERGGLTRDFLITGTLDGQQKFPGIGFGRSQFDKYLKALKARGLVDVIQRGRGEVVWWLNISAILAKGSGSTGRLEVGRVPAQRGEGFRSGAEKGSGPTELVKSISAKTISKEAPPNPAQAPEAGGGADFFDLEEAASPLPEGVPVAVREAEKFSDARRFSVKPKKPDRTIRSERGRYAGSKGHDIEAVQEALGDAADPWEQHPEPDESDDLHVRTAEGQEAAIDELERVWLRAFAFQGKRPEPFDRDAASELVDRFPAEAGLLVANAALYWEAAMAACFGYMTITPLPPKPKLGFIKAYRPRLNRDRTPKSEPLDHPSLLLDALPAWGDLNLLQHLEEFDTLDQFEVAQQEWAAEEDRRREQAREREEAAKEAKREQQRLAAEKRELEQTLQRVNRQALSDFPADLRPRRRVARTTEILGMIEGLSTLDRAYWRGLAALTASEARAHFEEYAKLYPGTRDRYATVEGAVTHLMRGRFVDAWGRTPEDGETLEFDFPAEDMARAA